MICCSQVSPYQAFRMSASPEYKQRLANWIEEEIQKWGSADRLSARLAATTSQHISGEQIRKWAKSRFVKELDPKMLNILALYRGESIEETRAWLNGNSTAPGSIQPITRSQIEQISDPTDLIQLQIWIAERHKALLERSIAPNTQVAFRTWLMEHLEQASTQSCLSVDRLREIAAGSSPTARELINLSRCWTIQDAEWLLNLFGITAKTESVQLPSSCHPAKTRRE